MGGGEENSVKLLRVRTSGRQGLGPTSPHSCWGCLAFRDLEEQQRKRPKYSTALHWTGLDWLSFRFPALPCYHPTPPTYQLLPDLLYFSTVRNAVFIRTQTREAGLPPANVAFLRPVHKVMILGSYNALYVKGGCQGLCVQLLSTKRQCFYRLLSWTFFYLSSCSFVRQKLYDRLFMRRR